MDPRCHLAMTESSTVLIAEDEQPLAELYDQYLNDLYTIRFASNGTQAVMKVDESVDVIVLDRRLPGKSGDDVVKVVRDQNIDVQIIMVSAVQPDFKILNLEIDAYIVKPVNQDELRDYIDRVLTRATYPESIQEYYALREKQKAIAAVKHDDDLGAHSAYTALEDRLTELETQIDSLPPTSDVRSSQTKGA
jgi:DNA-binding response OmpR family regulator